MRKEINDTELEQVCGGIVTLSANLGIVQFSSVGKTYMINQGVDFRDIRNCLLDLYDQNANLSDAAFDKLVAKTFRANGWI